MTLSPNEIRSRYDHLDHFIGTEFLQDFDSSLTVERAVDRFFNVYERHDSISVLHDIRRFLHEQHNDIEAAFEGFRPQVHPPGLGMTVAEWLAEIARLFEARLAPTC